MDMRYEAGKRLEKLQTWIVWKLPRWLVKWAFFRVVAHATSGQYGNTDVVNLTWGDAADRWESQ